jgi:hypothetical protein
VGNERFTHQLSDRHARTQAGGRILKDHLEPSTQLAQFLSAKGHQIYAIEPNQTRRWSQKAQHGSGKRRFPTAGLADNADAFPGLHLQINAVDCSQDHVVPTPGARPQ